MTSLLFIHGLGDDKTTWDDVLAQPFLQPFRCNAVNVPGFGGTTWNGESLEDAAGKLWDQYGTDETVVVGHSMGGTIAILMAENRPKGLRGIINVEGNLTESGAFLSSRAVAAEDFDSWWARFVPKQVPRYRAALEKCDPRAFLACSKDLYGVSVGDAIGHRYRAVSIPKLYIHGSDRIEATIGRHLDDQLKVDLAGGHWIQEDQPVAVAVNIAHWVRELITTARS